MPHGYNGKILHVDLSSLTTQVESPDEVFYRTYMGGGCLGAYYLLKETKPGIDPLGPENVIIFAASILTGAPVPGLSRHVVITKSPLTGIFLDSEAGGFFGAELKKAGYDAIVVKGKADKPTYLWIKDGEVQFKDASHLWGKSTGDSQAAIRDELNEAKARMVMIGPGGENLVRYACILNECKHANGRGGSGAVMGSKNLKAIVCRGSLDLNFFDKEAVRDCASWFARTYKDNPVNDGLQKFGSAEYVDYQMEHEELPSFNFQTGSIEGGERLSGENMTHTILVKGEGCYACPVACKRVVAAEEPFKVDPLYGGPEYETISALGSNCGITDLVAISKGNELCNMHSLDTISTGASIAFAMECFEKGLISKEDADGLDLTFGNADAMVKMVEAIALRKGKLGDLLAEGVQRAAQKIGQGAEDFAIHSKGMEIAMHDPRAKGMVGIGYACSALGGDHVVVEHDTDFDEYAPEIFMDQVKCLGIQKRLPATSVAPEKIRNFVYLQDHFSFLDSLCLCVFAFFPVRNFTLRRLMETMDAITGWENSAWEVMKLGERRTNLAKAFNVREGLRRKDDILPKRFYDELKKKHSPGLKIDKQAFNEAIDLLYDMMGWDEEGIPRKSKLIELDVAWVINEIYP